MSSPALPALRLALLPAALGAAALLALPAPPTSAPGEPSRRVAPPSARATGASAPGAPAARAPGRNAPSPAGDRGPPMAPAVAEPPPRPDAPVDVLDPAKVDEEVVLSTVRAIMQRRPMLAYKYLKQLETMFPGSPLAEERERYLIEALIELGRKTEARDRAEAFLSEHPTGIHAQRVQWFLDYPLND